MCERMAFLYKRVLTRLPSGSLSLSKDESMIAANNTHDGFSLYSLPYGTPIGYSAERDLYPTAVSNFLNSDRLLVYPNVAGVLKLWDIPTKSPLGSVGGSGESYHAIPLQA